MVPQLNTTTRSASQSTTQTPQSTAGSSVGGVQTRGVQSGTPADVLRSTNGIPLSNTALSVVNLGGTTTSATTSSKPVTPKHHANVPLLGFSALLIVIAIVMFWIDSRSVKTTT